MGPLENKSYQRYYRPLGQNVLIQPVIEELSESGLILGESALSPIVKAKVMSKGPGTPDVEMFVKYGDMVLVPRNHGTPITFNKVTMWVIKQSDIIALI